MVHPWALQRPCPGAGEGGAWKRSIGPHLGVREEAKDGCGGESAGPSPPPAALGRTCPSSPAPSPAGPAPAPPRLRDRAGAASAPATQAPGSGLRGGNARPGFPPSRARARRRGRTPAGRGCNEDPAGSPAALGTGAWDGAIGAPPPAHFEVPLGHRSHQKQVECQRPPGRRASLPQGTPSPGSSPPTPFHREETEAQRGQRLGLSERPRLPPQGLAPKVSRESSVFTPHPGRGSPRRRAGSGEQRPGGVRGGSQARKVRSWGDRTRVDTHTFLAALNIYLNILFIGAPGWPSR